MLGSPESLGLAAPPAPTTWKEASGGACAAAAAFALLDSPVDRLGSAVVAAAVLAGASWGATIMLLAKSVTLFDELAVPAAALVAAVAIDEAPLLAGSEEETVASGVGAVVL